METTIENQIISLIKTEQTEKKEIELKIKFIQQQIKEMQKEIENYENQITLIDIKNNSLKNYLQMSFQIDSNKLIEEIDKELEF